jgi:S-DNA-T family DNA segregation ATPase FtsK/SpoIIIE
MAKHLITVSQLKCAVQDAEWRARWLRGEDPPTMIVDGADDRLRFSVQGASFHRLAGQFVAWLCAESKTTRRLATAPSLWDALYERFARPKLDELVATGKVPSAQHLSLGLRAFCVQVANLRARTPQFRTWQDVYLTQEIDIAAVPFVEGAVLVSGRPDAVRRHPETGVEVIDYKLSRGANLKHDLVQLAVYANLLRRTKPGLRFGGVLEYYEPTLHVVPVSVVELEGIYTEIVAPVLKEIAAWDPVAPVSPTAGPSVTVIR